MDRFNSNEVLLIAEHNEIEELKVELQLHKITIEFLQAHCVNECVIKQAFNYANKTLNELKEP